MEIEFTVNLPDGALEGSIAENMDRLLRAALPGAVEEMERIRAASMEVVPVDSGDLRNSALVVGVNPADIEGGFEVAIGYGGIASSYAVIQHENPEFRHAEGKSWKYLERPAFEAINGMDERLAASLIAQLLGGVSASS